MDNLDHKRQKALLTNKLQTDFYENKVANKRKLNPVMKAWEGWRKSVYKLWSEIGVHNAVAQKHREWLGDIGESSVLDLGCYTGNVLSVELASNAGTYLGIDLSSSALDQLRIKFDDQGLSDARLEAVDFLDPDFQFEPFDLIYANAVLHHFADFELLLPILWQRLAPGGRVLTYDPMETAFSIWLVRRLYRPFQSNDAWECPFSKRTIKQIERYFEIEYIQGVVGYSKWTIPLAFLPLGDKFLAKLGKKLHNLDMKYANHKGFNLWQCMSVCICLRRKDTVSDMK